MDNIGLNITTIRLPTKPQFPKLVEQLIHACHEYRQLKNKPSTKAQADRYLHCHTLIEGLYQTWSCQSPYARLDVFLSPQYYHSKEFGKINHLTQHYVEETVCSLEQLGWAEVIVGRRVDMSVMVPTKSGLTDSSMSKRSSFQEDKALVVRSLRLGPQPTCRKVFMGFILKARD